MGLFGPKRQVIKAGDLCKKYLDLIFSSDKRSFYVSTLASFKSEYAEFKKVDQERYVDEIIALNIEILAFAWAQASLRGVTPRKHSLAMAIATFGGSDSRLTKYEPLMEAYNSAIGRAARLPQSDSIREATLTLLARLGINDASKGLVERLYCEFSALCMSMLEGLKLWKLVS